MVPTDQTQQFPADLSRRTIDEIRRLAQERGISFNEALLSLAEEARVLRKLGRDLGVKSFARPPH